MIEMNEKEREAGARMNAVEYALQRYQEEISPIPFLTAEEWKALNETYRSMEAQAQGCKV
jgi:hypothetical protein